MKIKSSDNWAFKMGLVGFYRILEYNKDSLNIKGFNYVVKEDYIEFDDSLLDNFDEYYFNYFLGTYDSAKKTCGELDSLLVIAKKQDLFEKTHKEIIKKILSNNEKVKKMVTPSYVQAENIRKEIATIKKIKDLDLLLKSLQKYNFLLKELNLLEECKTLAFILNDIDSEINFEVQLNKCKEFIKKTNSLIAKIKLDIYDYMIDITDKVKKCTNVDELTDLIEAYKKCLKDDYVNKINSLNRFKRVLSENYFGQEGFLNSSLSKLSLLEQQAKIKSKYVAPVTNYLCLKNIQKSKTVDEILNIIKSMEHYDDKVTKGFLKTIKTNCASVGNTSVNCFEYQDKCILCEEEYSIGHIFTESSFIPLAVSNTNVPNLFWNFNTNRPICPICQLILFCAPAGATNVFKNYLKTEKFSDKSYQAFISLEGSLKDLVSINNDFSNRTSGDTSFNNSFGALILNYLDVQRKASLWQLQNILYIEFNVDYKSKNTKLNYMNIPHNVATFLSKKENIFLIKSIDKAELQKEVLDNMLLGRDLRNIIFKNISNCIKYWKHTDIVTILLIQKSLNIYKKRGEFMEIKEKNFEENYNIMVKEGEILRGKLYGMHKENKLQSIAYKLLNLARTRNSKDMFDAFARLYLSYGMRMPDVLLDIRKESIVDMEDIAGGFAAGLLKKDNYDFEKTTNNNTANIKEK